MVRKYNIIYADPPWETGYVYGGLTAGSVGGGHLVPYGTMSDKEIIDLPISAFVADSAFLFIWVIDSRIPIISKIMDAWGFRYSCIGFIWNKRSMYDEHKVRTTLTPYTRRSCEYCFLGLKGKTGNMVRNHYVLQFVNVPIPDRRIHSSKPGIIRDRIVELCGDIPRIELFARTKIEGWDCWGNEVESDIDLGTERYYEVDNG